MDSGWRKRRQTPCHFCLLSHLVILWSYRDWTAWLQPPKKASTRPFSRCFSVFPLSFLCCHSKTPKATETGLISSFRRVNQSSIVLLLRRSTLLSRSPPEQPENSFEQLLRAFKTRIDRLLPTGPCLTTLPPLEFYLSRQKQQPVPRPRRTGRQHLMGLFEIRSPTSLRLSMVGGDGGWDQASSTRSPLMVFMGTPHDSHPPLGHLILLVFGAVLEVVCVSLPGYVIARLGHFDADKQKFLANLNVMLFTPCLSM